MLNYEEWAEKYKWELCDEWNDRRGYFESKQTMMNYLYKEYVESAEE